MKTIENLNKGETLLTTIRKVKGGKFQVEIVEYVENPNAKINVAAALNAGDDRFTQFGSKPRRAWQSATPEGLALLGINVTTLKFATIEGKEIASVNMLNPEISGERLHIRLVDSDKPAFEGHKPKQSPGKDGQISYFMKDGKHIYQSSQIVADTVTHSIITADAIVTKAGIVNKVSASQALNS